VHTVLVFREYNYGYSAAHDILIQIHPCMEWAHGGSTKHSHGISPKTPRKSAASVDGAMEEADNHCICSAVYDKVRQGRSCLEWSYREWPRENLCIPGGLFKETRPIESVAICNARVDVTCAQVLRSCRGEEFRLPFQVFLPIL
jgi:hypothetical protein